MIAMAVKLLLRNWRSGALRLVVGSLVLAVAVVTSVALLADRVERALTEQSATFLAADLAVRGPNQPPPVWQQWAAERGLATSRIAAFNSMVYAGEQMHLAAVKAVDDGYPLRGELVISEQPFSQLATDWQPSRSGPPRGQVWVDARLLPLLDVVLGDTIELGATELTIGKVVVTEPDRGGSFSLFGARVLMHYQDLEAAAVIQPGSRVRYRFLVAGESAEVAGFNQRLSAGLSAGNNQHWELITPERAEASIADTVQRGRTFLLLAGSVGVILAGVALALASRQFADSQLGQVALLKCWGVGAGRVRRLYFAQLLVLAALGSAAGLLLGWLFHAALLAALADYLPAALPAAGGQPWLVGAATGALALVGFALPALWHLPGLPPLAVLRSDIAGSPLGLAARLAIAAVIAVALLYGYSGNLWISVALLATLAALAVLIATVAVVLLRAARSVGNRLGGVWRMAGANLWRARLHSQLQMLGFAAAIALLMVMAVVRGSLIDEWRWQLADDAPNHFLVNVAPYEIEPVKALLAERKLSSAGWFSMVRGRLVEINGAPPPADLKERHESLNRELNLSWSASLPENNQLVAGNWWPADLTIAAGEPIPMSIEVELADELGLQLGDQVTFSIGGLRFSAELVNTRALRWESMTPNFYFLFPEGVLEEFPRSGITSLHIPASEKLVINDLLRRYPTVVVIELDKVISQIQSVVNQVTQGLQMMTGMILLCGVLILYAGVALSMPARLQQSALLRTLGSSRRTVLRIQAVEFALLGGIAGLIAAVAAELALAAIVEQLFAGGAQLHLWLWLAGPLGGAALVALLGVGYSARSVGIPPLQLLRRLN